MATLVENAAAVKAASTAIDAAIVAKGGTTSGGLRNAAAAIAALPSGGDTQLLIDFANGTLSGDVTLPDSITKIYGNQFFDRRQLTSLTANGIVEVMAGGLEIRNGLNHVSFPNLAIIRNSAFLQTTFPLSDIDFSKVEVLEASAFSSRNNSLDLPSGELNMPMVTTISLYNFNVTGANAVIAPSLKTLSNNSLNNTSSFSKIVAENCTSAGTNVVNKNDWEFWIPKCKTFGRFLNVYRAKVYIGESTANEIMGFANFPFSSSTQSVFYGSDKFVKHDGTAWVVYEYDEATPNPFTEG